MTDEEIHNIYLHMSGKAEGLVEATGNADFPVLFARAILEYGGLTKDMQNMASKSTYKEQLETKYEPVVWMNRHGACKTSLLMEVEAGAKEEYTIPLYTTQQQRKPLTRDEVEKLFWEWKDRSGYSIALFEFRNICNAIEAAHGIKE